MIFVARGKGPWSRAVSLQIKTHSSWQTGDPSVEAASHPGYGGLLPHICTLPEVDKRTVQARESASCRAEAPGLTSRVCLAFSGLQARVASASAIKGGYSGQHATTRQVILLRALNQQHVGTAQGVHTSVRVSGLFFSRRAGVVLGLF